MSTNSTIDPYDDLDMPVVDDLDFAGTPWSVDELERSADLGSVRSAWAGSADAGDF